MIPKRVQRKRLRGWRKPDGAVYAGRPSKWENIHSLIQDIPNVKREWVIAWFKQDLWAGRLKFTVEDVRRELSQVPYLMCWCKEDEPCHVDILIELVRETHHFLERIPESTVWACRCVYTEWKENDDRA